MMGPHPGELRGRVATRSILDASLAMSACASVHPASAGIESPRQLTPEEKFEQDPRRRQAMADLDAMPDYLRAKVNAAKSRARKRDLIRGWLDRCKREREMAAHPRPEPTHPKQRRAARLAAESQAQFDRAVGCTEACGKCGTPLVLRGGLVICPTC